MSVKKTARKKFKRPSAPKHLRKIVKASTPAAKPVVQDQTDVLHDNVQVAPVNSNSLDPEKVLSALAPPSEASETSEQTTESPAASSTPDAAPPEVAPVATTASEAPREDSIQKPTPVVEASVTSEPSWSQSAQKQVGTVPTKRSYKKLFLIIVVLIIIALFAGAVPFFIGSSAKKQETSVNEKKEEVAEPTKKPEFHRSEVTFEVLNGSGVSGAAASASATLSSLGYTVVKTANAEKQTYESSILFVSEDMSDMEKEQLLSDIADLFAIKSISGKLTDSTASARLILGKD